MRLLRELQNSTGEAVDLHVFRGFNGRLVAKNPRATAPSQKKITYGQFLRFLSLRFSGVMSVSAADFRKQFATQSGRGGGASLGFQCGRSGGVVGLSRSLKHLGGAYVLYEIDTTRLFSVLRVAMGPPKTTAPDVRIERESADWRRRSNLPTWSVYLRVHLLGRERKRREVKNLFATATRRPLSSTRRRILRSLGIRMCIRYLPMWY